MGKSILDIIKGSNLYIMVLTQYGVKQADISALGLSEKLKEGGFKSGKTEAKKKD